MAEYTKPASVMKIVIEIEDEAFIRKRVSNFFVLYQLAWKNNPCPILRILCNLTICVDLSPSPLSIRELAVKAGSTGRHKHWILRLFGR